MKSKDTRERIIGQALRYFMEHDYERASLNHIARALRITKGGIYHYFGSKEDLLKATVLHVMNTLDDLFKQMAAFPGPFEEELKQWFAFDRMMEETAALFEADLFKDYGNQLYLMFTAAKKFPEVRERIDTIFSGFIDTLGTRFERAAREGEIRPDIDPRALAFELAAFSEGALLLGTIVSGLDIGAMGRRTYKEFWNRIKPRMKPE